MRAVLEISVKDVERQRMRRQESNWCSDHCECGGSKRRNSLACDRCAFLDGTTDSNMELIHILRDVADGLTCEAIAHETGRHREAVYRSLEKLMARGRVVRRQLSGDESGSKRNDGGWNPYVYRLAECGAP